MLLSNRPTLVILPLLFVVSLLGVPRAEAQSVDVQGGVTSVLLDTDLLAAAAGLDLTAATDVEGGLLGGGSVAFPINARDAATLPTTFSYDPADFLGTFGGTIEHTGSVTFNTDIAAGDFTIGFDAARQVSLDPADASGFFVQSNTGATDGVILFDIGGPSELSPTATELRIGADLFVAPEFAQVLIDLSLTTDNLTGADVGDALVTAAIPEPTTAVLAALAAVGLAARRRG